jgi:uncharacterized phage-associated protein
MMQISADALTGDGLVGFEPERLGRSVRGIANWVLDYADELGVTHTNMGVNKLVFFAVEAFLLKRRKLLTNAKIEAWEHGPVFRELYQSFKSFGNGPILSRAKAFSVEKNEFEEVSVQLEHDEKEFLRAELAPLMHMSAAALRDISHKPESAWHKVWWYKGHANPGMEISPSLLLTVKGGKVET